MPVHRLTGMHQADVEGSRPVPTVLVVEDDVEQAMSLAAVIEDLGYRVICAANGQEALSRLRECSPCLVLVDLFMPVMGGIEFLHRLREEPDLIGIPKVIMTSANDQMVGVKEDASVLFKPLDLDEVVQVVRRHCGARETSFRAVRSP